MNNPSNPPSRACLGWVAALLLGLAPACTSPEGERDETLLEIYTNTAESYYQLGDNDRAIGQAIKALEIDPDNVKLKLILGWSLQRRGRTDDVLKAEMIFRDIIDEEDFRAPLGLATSLERQGMANEEAAEAIESGKRITEAPDPVARALELHAKAQSLWQESSGWYEKTLELQKTNLDALNGLQRVDALVGRKEASLERSRELVTALGTDRAFWTKRLEKPELGEREETEIRTMVKRLTDLEVVSRSHAARLHHELGRPGQALEQLDIAIDLAPDRPDLHGMRAVVQKELGHYDAAIADAERFIALSPQSGDSPDIQKAHDLLRECLAHRTAKTQP
jgi:tetratricopeptide (TPR) repeat protein